MKSENFQSAISRPFITTESGTRAKKAVFADLDSEVLAAVRGGETEAFGKLVSLYEDFVYTLVYGIVRSEEAAKDIAQETFLRAYKGIRRFELKSSFKTWLYRIAHNTAISYVNRQKNERLVDMDQIDQKATDRMNSHSLKLTLEKLIGKLNPTYRAVVIFTIMTI